MVPPCFFAILNQQPRRESNPYLPFRRGPFYPLNYEAGSVSEIFQCCLCLERFAHTLQLVGIQVGLQLR